MASGTLNGLRVSAEGKLDEWRSRVLDPKASKAKPPSTDTGFTVGIEVEDAIYTSERRRHLPRERSAHLLKPFSFSDRWLKEKRNMSSSRQQQTSPKTSPTEEPFGELEPVAYFHGAMLTGVTVSQRGRIFVNFPKWGDDVEFTVAELCNGEAVAYPDEAFNRTDEDDPAAALVSVQSVVVDPSDRLWILDTGSPLFKPTEYGGPKLVCVDLTTDQVIKKILFPQDVALPTTYLNDVRFDLRRGTEGVAFITDSAQKGANGIIVVDLDTGESWRRLNDHPSTKAEDITTFLPIVEGRPFLEPQPDGSFQQGAGMGTDGIAISADGLRLYYCPLGSRKLYSVATDALCDRTLDDEAVAATVREEGDRGGARVRRRRLYLLDELRAQCGAAPQL